jgi:hypothetical protein
VSPTSHVTLTPLTHVCLESKPPAFIFEARIPDIAIESPPFPGLPSFQKSIQPAIPVGPHEGSCIVYLRPYDKIHFPDSSLIVELVVEIPDNMAPSRAISRSTVADSTAAEDDTIHVRSSHEQPPPPNPEDVETDDSDGDDLGKVSSSKIAEERPATTVHTTHPAIPETPNTRPKPQEAPYSTAPEHPETANGASSSAPERRSPLAQKSAESQEAGTKVGTETQASGSLLMQKVGGDATSNETEESQDLVTTPTSSRKTITYGKWGAKGRRGKATPRSSSRAAADSEIVAEDEITVAAKTGGAEAELEMDIGQDSAKNDAALENVQATGATAEDEADAEVENVEQNVELPTSEVRDEDGIAVEHAPQPDQEPAVPLTSDARDEHGTATEAARRSIQGTKRKHTLPRVAETDEYESPMPIKRCKVAEVAIPSDETPQSSGKLKRRSRFTLQSSPQRSAARSPRPQVSGKLKRLSREDTENNLQKSATSSLRQRESGSSKRPAAKEPESAGDEIVVAHPAGKAKAWKATETTPKATSKATPKAATRSESPASSLKSAHKKPSKILLSSTSFPDKSPAITWLRQQGISTAESTPGKNSNFICVVPDARLPTTMKVLQSLVSGKLVVGEKWVLDSHKKKEILDPTKYLHKDLESTITLDRKEVFGGQNLFFTKKLAEEYSQSWQAIQTLAKQAGAISVTSGPADKGNNAKAADETIFFGSTKSDPDVAKLVNDYERTVYSKDLVSQSILDGELDLDSDEHIIKLGASASKGKKL